jgi:hypothetical protein
MEDVMQHYDGTIRNSLGDVVQFLYGEDGLAGEFVEKQKLESIKMDDSKLKSVYHMDLTDTRVLEQLLEVMNFALLTLLTVFSRVPLDPLQHTTRTLVLPSLPRYILT